MSMLGPAADILHRNMVACVSEARGWWLKGRFLYGGAPTFELSFEDYGLFVKARRPDMLLADGVPITYLGIWRDERCCAEFQFGTWAQIPRTDEEQQLVVQIAAALKGHRPMQVFDPSFFPSVPTGTGGLRL